MIALFFNLSEIHTQWFHPYTIVLWHLAIDKHGPVYVVGWSTEIFLECSIVKSTVMVGLPFVAVKYKLHLVDWSLLFGYF
jgi:hypothetical protein